MFRCLSSIADACPVISFGGAFKRDPYALFPGSIWPKDGFASIALQQWRAVDFLPLPAKAAIPREARKHAPPRRGLSAAILR
jgi:hypothetical protein